jgi:hypothetical protein
MNNFSRQATNFPKFIKTEYLYEPVIEHYSNKNEPNSHQPILLL